MLVKKEEIKVVPIRENHHSNKTVLNLDDALFEDEEEKEAYFKKLNENEEMEFSEEYYKIDWSDTPAAESEEKILTMQEFYNMPYGCSQYFIYKQLVNISSILSDIKEVLSDGNKTE